MTPLLLQHPLSAAFPEMDDAEFQALKDSIEAIGVQNPITLFEGRVLDGWHRYCACSDLGMHCPQEELGDVDPQEFVMAQNKARRNVSQAQMALATTTVYAWRPSGSNQHSKVEQDTECPAGKTTAELAEIAGVHASSIKQARTVQAKASPEVQQAVRDGKLGLPKAAAIARLPAGEQATAIDKPTPKKEKPAPPPPPETPDYTELDAAHDQISALQADLVVARMGDVPADEKTQAAEKIAELSAEIKTLKATLKATELARDGLMEERSQMLRQLKAQRSELDQLKRK